MIQIIAQFRTYNIVKIFEKEIDAIEFKEHIEPYYPTKILWNDLSKEGFAGWGS